MSSRKPRIRCAAVSGLSFFAALYLVVNAWSAIDIFLLGNFDAKFGGPMGNLFFGMQISALAFAVCAAGCVLAVLLLMRWLDALRGGLCWLTGAAAAAVALGLLAAGLFPWFEGLSPLPPGTVDMAFALLLIGALAGSAGGVVVWRLKARKRR